MRCSDHTPLLNDEQLSAVLDGNADVSILEHLGACPVCRRRLEQARQFEYRLRERLQRVECPPTPWLADYQFALLADSLRVYVEQHLQVCQFCQAELQQLQGLAEVTNPAQTVLLPRPWLARQARFSYSSLPVRGMRGTLNRPIIAEADGVTVLLDVEEDDDGRLLIDGSVSAGDQQEHWRGAFVEIYQNAERCAVRALDDDGCFNLSLAVTLPIDLRLVPIQGTPLRIDGLKLET